MQTWILLAGPNSGFLNLAWRWVTGSSEPLVNVYSFAGLILVIALLYYAFVKRMAEELGEAHAIEIAKAAIAEYGTITGQETERRVRELGLAPVIENYARGKDLPSRGWKKGFFPATGRWTRAGAWRRSGGSPTWALPARARNWC